MKRKKKTSRESFVTAVGMLTVAFGAVLLFGWFVMTAHLDSDVYGDVVELALSGPYYSWIEKVAVFYWALGVKAIVTIFIVVFFEDKLKHSDQLMFIAYTILLWLLGSSLLIGFFVALIKMHAVKWVFIISCLLVLFLIMNSIVLLLKFSSKIVTISFLVVAFIIILALCAAQATDELYIIIKNSLQFSNLESKLLLWVEASLGLFIFACPFYWKLRGRWEKSVQ
ncbi:hypothetical protein [Neobacillus mesonae]|uniref:hypothetical protein n=1 Tax=Neobacillus mesonae TaxID=1193713 RepID=UPI002E247559|nr:hypothetical protein [Neobacillus mesonae]